MCIRDSTTIVYWAKKAEAAYQDLFGSLFGMSSDQMDQTQLNSIMNKIADGQTCILYTSPPKRDRRRKANGRVLYFFPVYRNRRDLKRDLFLKYKDCINNYCV